MINWSARPPGMMGWDGHDEEMDEFFEKVRRTRYYYRYCPQCEVVALAPPAGRDEPLRGQLCRCTQFHTGTMRVDHWCCRCNEVPGSKEVGSHRLCTNCENEVTEYVYG